VTFSNHFFVQIGLWLLMLLDLGAQYLPMIQGIVPAKYQPVIAAVIALISAMLGLVHQFYNPDGTKAQLPWVPPSPKG
jgi:hypothetical protein